MPSAGSNLIIHELFRLRHKHKEALKKSFLCEGKQGIPNGSISYLQLLSFLHRNDETLFGFIHFFI